MGASSETAVTVRWRDVDAFGHVNHAVFLTYLELGRDALLDPILGGPSYVIARVEIDFTGEIPLGTAEVRVRVEVEALGRTSVTTAETISLPTGEVAARARVVSVCWDGDAHAPRSFTDAERAALEADGPVRSSR